MTSAQSLVADVVDHPPATRNSASFDKLHAENGRPCSAGVDLAIFLISRRCGRVNFGGRPPLYSVQRAEPVGVEVADHITHPVLAGERDLRDRGCVHALGRQQHHLRPVTTDPLPRRTIRTSRRPSSSSISRTRSRSATGPVSGIRIRRQSTRPDKRDLLRTRLEPFVVLYRSRL